MEREEGATNAKLRRSSKAARDELVPYCWYFGSYMGLLLKKYLHIVTFKPSHRYDE